MQKRELWKVILFGLITLGIYDLYWLYTTRKEMVAKGAKIPPVKVLFLPIAILLAMLIIFFAYGSNLHPSYGTPDNLAQSQYVNEIVAVIVLVINGLAFLALIPLAIWWWYKYSKGVELATKGRMNFEMSFWLGLLFSFFSVGFIMPGLVQDAFNKTK